MKLAEVTLFSTNNNHPPYPDDSQDPALVPEELISVTLLVDKPIYSTPLTAAACHGHRSIVELLLNRGAKLTTLIT